MRLMDLRVEADRSRLAGSSLRRRDLATLLLLCALLIGVAALSGRPLSMHEARLPELAREMVAGNSNFLLPLSGGRPWLERPPLPHWFTAASMALFHRVDVEWVARIPAAIAGTGIVLMGAWMAAIWFGRATGILAGVVLATTYELYTYSSMAEDDIYLAAVAVAAMAMFVKAETSNMVYASIFSRRAWPIVSMFFLLGLTNLAKGPLVGAAPVIAGIGACLIWNSDAGQWRRYVWPWGILMFLALTLAWPLLALWRYPDVWDNWVYDYTGHTGEKVDTEYNHAVWYYLAMMPMILAPWIWAAILGLIVTARRAWKVRGSAERLLWCWAIVGLVVLSLPARKHHHYFLPLVVPWAILAARGLVPVGQFLLAGKGPVWTRRPLVALLFIGVPGAAAIFWFRQKIAGPAMMPALLAATWCACVWLFYEGQWRKNGYLLIGAVVLGYAVTAGWLETCVVGRDRASLAEIAFLRKVPACVPSGQLLTVNAAGADLEFFRLQFYLPESARLLHNLSFLRSDQIQDPAVFVVARASDEEKLKQLGEVQVVLRSDASFGENSPADRFTLFHLTFAAALKRAPLPPYIGVMEAMDRKKGPWCGREL